ncbi:MAG: hypothetical protein SAL70_35435 [Scytonema sp. PMC 1070.18]|nr:hypothetical protein [Scytonema sp. PMC 1070.18]
MSLCLVSLNFTSRKPEVCIVQAPVAPHIRQEPPRYWFSIP